MIDFVIEKEINRPPAEVFAYVVDASKLATWQTNTVSAMPDGPIGLGTKIREVHRAPAGKRIESLVYGQCVPMVSDVAAVLARLGRREHFTGDEDRVFAGPSGGRANATGAVGGLRA